MAWLLFAILASAWPFVFHTRCWEPDGHGVWTFQAGAVSRLEADRSMFRGDPITVDLAENTVQWAPDTRQWRSFSGFGGARPTVEFIVPPWAVLLAPTVLVLGGLHGVRFTLRRRRARHAKRKGRTPCPTCNYDATNLTTCPECGATISPVTETQT